jgi:hypothetical protein
MSRPTLLLLAALLALTGCSRHYHPLAASKKARLVSELLSKAPQCDGFRQRLLSPNVEDDRIDDIYHAAAAPTASTRMSDGSAFKPIP